MLRKALVAPASLLLAAASVGVVGIVGVSAAGAATTAAFRATGSMLQPAEHATATLLRNGDVLVAGGANPAGTPLAGAELYDPSTGSWSATGSLPLAVSQATATLLRNGEVLVAGGLTDADGSLAATPAAELYDPATGSWSATGPLATASYDAGAALVGSGEVLYAGGLPSAAGGALATAAAELYNPWKKTFTATKPLPVGVAGAETTALANGTVLVAGGATGASGAASPLSEVFEPSSSSWVPVGHMAVPVARATSTLLGGGNVLVAGGQTSAGGAPTADTQLYDTSTGHWLYTGTVPVASYAATATVLGSGELLYAGGLTASGAPTASAALYDPSAHTWAATSPLLVPSGFAVSSRLGSGAALVASGLTASGVTGEGEVYSVQTVASTPQGKSPAITSGAAATIEVGHDIALTVRATGTPVPTLSESGALPPGMAFRDNHNGTANIYGTPAASAAASYAVTVYASNGVSPTAAQRLVINVVRPPAFTSAASVSLVAGKWGAFDVVATGSPAPSLSESGALPPGMAFRDNHNGTATIAGTLALTDAGNYAITVYASNGYAPAAAQHLVLSVAAVTKPAVITSAAAVSVSAGKWADFTLSASGTPTPVLSESGALPPGLVFQAKSAGTATISGTLAASDSGAYAVTIYATNHVGAVAAQRLVITVAPAVVDHPALITSPAAATLVAGRYAAVTVTTSASPVASVSESGGLPPGLAFRPNSDGTATIYGTPTVSDNGVYVVTIYATNHVGATAAQRLSLTVEHPAVITSAAAVSLAAGKYASFTVSSTGTPVPTLSESGALPAGLVFHANSNGTATISGTLATSDRGTYAVTVYAGNNVGATAAQRLVLSVAPPAVTTRPALITSSAGTTVLAGRYAAFTVTTSASPVATLSESGGLPPGMAFRPNSDGTATIYGTPAVSDNGVYVVTIYATNHVGATAAQRLSLTVEHPAMITSSGAVGFTAGRYGAFTVSAAGTPIARCSESGLLPPGLSFRANPNGTASIYGAPAVTDNGTWVVTIYASNGIGATASQRLALTIAHAPVTHPAVFTSPATLGIESGTSTSFTVVASGTPAPTLSLSSGVLPPGLAFHNNGNGTATISGSTSALIGGTYTATIEASNGVGRAAVQRLSIAVSRPTPASFSTPPSHVVQAGMTSSVTVTSSGTPTPTLSESGTLPTGMSFQTAGNGTATISGTPAPSARGSYAMVIVATNGVGTPAVQRLSLTVAVPAAGVGYWYVTTSGQVLGQGAAKPIAPEATQHPSHIVAMAATPDQNGYYLVSSRGGVYVYGDAVWYGSVVHLRLKSPVVAITVTPSGHGYYLVTRGGNVFSFGDAHWYGSPVHAHIPAVTAFALTPGGGGYYVVTAKGNVYTYGNATWWGSATHRSNSPVVAFAPTSNGKGYWLVTAKGNVYQYGNARFIGSLAYRHTPPIVGFDVNAAGSGYWLVSSKGNVYNFGAAGFFGSSAHTTLSRFVAGFAAEL